MQYTEKQLKKIEANIWKYFFVLNANKRVFASIYGVFLLSVGSMTEKKVGLMLLIANIASFLFEIPSGYMSDKLGHKNTLVFSRFLLVLSSIGYIISTGFEGLLISSLLWALGLSFYSGSGAALMHNTLKALNKSESYSEILGRLHSYSFLISMLLSVSIPFLMTIDYKLPFYISLIITFIALIAAISLRRFKESDESKIIIKNIKILDVFKETLNTGFINYAVYFAFLYGSVFGVLLFRDPYQLFTGANLTLFGIYFAVGRFLTVLISRYSGYLKTKIGNIDNLVFVSFIIYSCLFISLGLFDFNYSVILCFIVLDGFMMGSFSLRDGFLLNLISESKTKATQISILTQMRAMVEGTVCFMVGLGITMYSYQMSFAIFSVVFVVVASLMCLNILRFKYKVTQKQKAL